jgi:hypothetical protein
MLTFNSYTLVPDPARFPADSIVSDNSVPGMIDITITLADTSGEPVVMDPGLIGQLAFTATSEGTETMSFVDFIPPEPPDTDGNGSRTRMLIGSNWLGNPWQHFGSPEIQISAGPLEFPDIEIWSQPPGGPPPGGTPVMCGEEVDLIAIVYGGESPYTINWTLTPDDDPGNPVVLPGPVNIHVFPEDRYTLWTCMADGRDSTDPGGIPFASGDQLYSNVPPNELQISGINLDFFPSTKAGATMVRLDAVGAGGCPQDTLVDFEVDWGDGQVTTFEDLTKTARIRDLHHFYGPGEWTITLTLTDARFQDVDGPPTFLLDDPPTDPPARNTFWLDSPDTSFGPNTTVRVYGYMEGADFAYNAANIKVATAPEPVVHRTGSQIASETPLWSPSALFAAGSSRDLGDNEPDDMYWISIGDVEINVPDDCHGNTTDAEWVSHMNFLTTSSPGVNELYFVIMEEDNTYFRECTTPEYLYPDAYRSLLISND